MPTPQQNRYYFDSSNRYDVDASDYFSRRAAAGDPVSTANKSAINKLVMDLKSAANLTPKGITHWAAWSWGCLLAGADTIAGGLIQLKNTSAVGLSTGFVKADCDRKLGWQGGVGKFVVGMAGNATGQDDFTTAAYLTGPPQTAQGVFGNSASLVAGYQALINSSGAATSRAKSTVDPGTNTPSTWLGLAGISRSVASSFILRVGGMDYTKTSVSDGNIIDPVRFFDRGSSITSSTMRAAALLQGGSMDLAYLDSILTLFVNSLVASTAEQDAQNYRALLAANGKTLADADYNNLLSFATQLYAVTGRQDFFTLRSAQNMGSGATAYTFQGKAVTLINGPTWGAEGLVTNSAAQRASASIIFSGVSDYTALAVVKNVNNTTPYPTIMGAGGASVSLSSGFNGFDLNWDSFNGTRVGGGAPFGVGSRAFVTGTVRGTAQEVYSGATQIATGTVTAAAAAFSTYWFMSRENQDYGRDSSIHSFYGIWPMGVTSSQVTTIYNAYKATIGSGLSLP